MTFYKNVIAYAYVALAWLLLQEQHILYIGINNANTLKC